MIAYAISPNITFLRKSTMEVLDSRKTSRRSNDYRFRELHMKQISLRRIFINLFLTCLLKNMNMFRGRY
jgi:hypothetical protein